MAQSKLYMLALYAMKPDPDRVEITQYEDGSYYWKMKDELKTVDLFSPVMLHAAMVCAASDEEAKAFGISKMLEYCPVADGWVNHHATVNPISEETLMKILDDLSQRNREEGEDELPEVVM